MQILSQRLDTAGKFLFGESFGVPLYLDCSGFIAGLAIDDRGLYWEITSVLHFSGGSVDGRWEFWPGQGFVVSTPRECR